MTAEANLAALQNVYRNWHESKGGSVGEILDLFDDEIRMHSALAPDVEAPVAGAHVTKAEARAYFEGLLAEWEMLAYEVDRFVVGDGGDEIVMIGRCAFRNRATGKVLDTPKIDVCTFRDGKIVRFQESYDTFSFARAQGLA